MAEQSTATESISLETHLQRENPLLLEPLAGFRKLDKVAQRLGLLEKGQSLTRRVPWWPVISVLGTFSAGKSTFINHYLETQLQATGNQAVDDRFTVICYGEGDQARTLPGSALDADPRFPFYRISGDINEVAAGEGGRINTYLQLKTCAADKLRGYILLDSPGFDADSQRTATLRITDRIIDLSDLVLVFFDARHPEPGAMRDTLQHLVAGTIKRDDASKFVFVLNQIDVTAREDNPEEVVAAWQRAMASSGLTAGRFLRIYDEAAAPPIEDEALAKRFKSKKNADLAEIHHRLRDVTVERAYRIVDMLYSAANTLQGAAGVEQIQILRRRWRWRTLLYDGLALLPVIALAGTACVLAWDNTLSVFSMLVAANPARLMTTIIILLIVGTLHFGFRGLAARQIAGKIPAAGKNPLKLDMRRAFLANTRWYRSLFALRPKGWHVFSRRAVTQVIASREPMVQKLNDQFTRPSG